MTAGFNLDFVDAGPLTTRLNNGAPNAYLHSDHLTSSVAQTGTAGTVSWHKHYTPFGERLIGEKNGNVQGFTNHVRDAKTGLNYMQARYYDPIIGRFLQTDPIGYQDQMNLYAYVYNDPLNNTDPTGECGPLTLVCAGIVGGAVFGAVTNAVSQFQENGGDIGATIRNFKPGEFGASVLTGAVIGGGIGAGGALAAGAGGSAGAAIAGRAALLGIGGSLVLEGIDDKNVTLVDVGKAVFDQATGKVGGKLLRAVDDVPPAVGEAVTTTAKGATDELYENESPQEEAPQEDENDRR